LFLKEEDENTNTENGVIGGAWRRKKGGKRALLRKIVHRGSAWLKIRGERQAGGDHTVSDQGVNVNSRCHGTAYEPRAKRGSVIRSSQKQVITIRAEVPDGVKNPVICFGQRERRKKE